MCSEKTPTWGKPIFFLYGQWLKIRHFAGCLHMNGIESTWGFVWGGFLMFVSVLTYITAMSVYFWLLTLGSFCLFCSWTCQCKSQIKLKASTSKVTETQIWFILWLELFLILLQPAAGELGLWWDTAGKHSVFYTDPLWLILWFPWKSIWSP